MLLQHKIVAIIGGGPGGLTLAKLLQNQGIKVTVYERDIDKNARVQGSPLDLHETSGLAAIHKAGLFTEFKANYMKGAHHKLIMDHRATVHYSDHTHTDTEDFGNPGFRPEIDRGVLRTMLLNSLAPETIAWNHYFKSLEAHNQSWLLHFHNAPTAYADIVIGADGANSKIRPYITQNKPFYTGITMIEGIIYNAPETAPNISKLLNGGKIMAFGKEKALLMGQKANHEIGFYISLKAETDWFVTNELDYANKAQLITWFTEHYSTWDNSWHELILGTTAPFIPRPITCMPLNQPWKSLPNLTMLGDAAHVMPPFAGEGVNMAMLDALELSELLTQSDCSTIHEAITTYETHMRNRAATVAQESIDNGELMHSEKALEHMLHFFQEH